MISPRAVLRGARFPALPRPAIPQRGRIAAWRQMEPLHLLWLAVWAPWWVGNELPPPAAPRLRSVDMVELPDATAGGWILNNLDDLRFRFGLSWAVALLLRGAWLGGIAGIVWTVAAMVSGVPSPTLTQIGIVVGIGAGLGLVLRLFHRPGYAAVAMLLERTFDLRSRLSTAVVGLRYGETGHPTLHELQLADAANALERSRSLLRPSHWVPIREIFILFIVALTLLLMLVARRPEGEIPAASTLGVPGFVPVSERLAAEQAPPPPEAADAATLQEVEDLSRASNQARQDLQTIGDALQSNGLTQPAADAITSENYPTANQQLSDASSAVSQQPASDREALANQMDAAADRVSEDNPELADAARNAADDVRSGEDTGALDDLGDQIEQTGESVISQQASGGELSDAAASQQSGTQSGSEGGSSSSAGQQPADSGSGASQPGSAGDPGAGMDASGGVASEDSASDQSSNGGTGQDGSSSGSASDGASGQESQDSASSSGNADTSAGGAANGAASDGSVNGSASEQDSSAQGSGAGGGDANTNEATDQTSNDGGTGGDLNNQDQAPEAGSGKAGDPPPGGNGGEGDQQDTQIASGGASVSLPGTSGERVSSGSDIGSSSVGSGGGVGAASGDSTSGVSGSAGPDPNDVPARWRSIVEDYFREGGTP